MRTIPIHTRPRLGLLLPLWVALVAAACGSGNASQPEAGLADEGVRNRLHTDGCWIRDSLNRAVILRGINVGSRSKLPPFLPFDDLSYLDQLASWGVNSIRLLFTWEGAEPEPGKYDDAYLEKLREILDGAAKRGIMVILDSHQDLYARNFCGDGFPDWTVPESYRAETCPRPFPLWPLSYLFSGGVVESFHRFWTDQDLRNAYIRMMAHVADRLGSHPAVIGFDLLNEPYDASYFRFDGGFERQLLIPFYRDLAAAIRERSPRGLVFYCTTGLFSVGFPTFLEPLGLPNAVFDAHWYDLGSLLFGAGKDLSGLRRRLRNLVDRTKDWQVPLWIGEYGIATDRTDNIPFLAGQIDLLEEFLVGSAIWTYNPTEVDWNLENTSLVGPGGEEKPHVGAFVRPYPDRIAGTPLKYRFDRESGALDLTFQADRNAKGPTEIVVPDRTFPRGFEVVATDGEWKWDPGRRRLLYSAPQDDSSRSLRLLPAAATRF